LAHLGRGEPHLDTEIDAASLAVDAAVEIGQRCRVCTLSRCRWYPGRLQGIERNDPGRNARREALGQEGAERLVFRALQVTSRPIVDQTQPCEMLLGLGDGDRLAKEISLPDPHADLGLEVEGRRRPESGRRRAVLLELAQGATDFGSAWHDRRSP